MERDGINEESAIVSADEARRFCQAVFQRAGLPERDAFLVADALVDADLRGVSTHGLVRFPIYVKRLRKGLTNPAPALRVVGGRGAVCVLDGDNGFGQVIAAEGMRQAVALASQHGVGMCSIRRGSHLGALAYLAALALPHQMIGITLSITNPVIAPWGGVSPLLGNNPLAVAVPAGASPPVILDMACSQVARGNLIVAAKLGKPIPLNWALDEQGRPTDDPEAGLRGSLLPVGGHKGAALALIVGILGGFLAGAPFGPGCGDIFDMTRPQEFGHLAMAIDIAAFCPLPAFLGQMQEMIRAIKAAPRGQGVAEISLPGELEFRRREERLRHGIPLSAVVWEEARAIGRELGVAWPAREQHGA